MKKSLDDELIRKMRDLKLPGLIEGYIEQRDNEPEYVHQSFADRFLQIINQAWDRRIDNRTERLMKRAHLPISGARFSELDYCDDRTFNRRTLNTLRSNEYVRHAHNVIITGATGTGKTFVACMLGNNACNDNLKVRYLTATELFDDLSDQSLHKPQTSSVQDVEHADLVIIDEFLAVPPNEAELVALYRFALSCEHKRSVVLCSRYAYEGWIQVMGGGPLVESILDRLRTSSYFLPISSKVSMRTKYEPIPQLDDNVPTAQDATSNR